MNKERSILMKLLGVAVFIPLILFIGIQISEIKTNTQRLSEYEKQDYSIDSVRSELLELESLKTALENNSEYYESVLFSENETTFYQFCDFLIDSAENRNLSIDNYNTNDSVIPKRISISASGKIENILNYLEHIWLYNKLIDIPKLSLKINESDAVWNLIMSVNFITADNIEEGSK